MNLWVIAAGLLAGLGAWLAVRELVPAGPSLRAAVGRLEAARTADLAGLASAGDGTGGLAGRAAIRKMAAALAAALPWLPVPAADLRLLGQDRGSWLASKLAFGLAGLAAIPVVSALYALGGRSLPWAVPVAGSLGLGLALFFVPDLITRVNAAEKRRDFRHALTSYLDLVALERGAGAAPTEALEAAAEVGGGWAFERIGLALDEARKASRAPWDALSQLAVETGVSELADLAEIAGIAGNDGARILDTLGARAESMRAEALAATKAQAGARSTTMVLPISMLAAGFLVLLIYPDFYRLFG
jgi:Flp pilus assembly protein TadB